MVDAIGGRAAEDTPTPRELFEDGGARAMLERRVDHWARVVPPGVLDRDEIRSAALLGLWDACLKWEPSRARGGVFATYARARVDGAILDDVRRANGHGFYAAVPRRRRIGRPLSLACVASPGRERRDRPAELGETIASGELPVGWELEYQDEARRLALLAGGPREYDVVLALTTRAATIRLKDAGAALGVGESRASQLLTRAAAAIAAATSEPMRRD